MTPLATIDRMANLMNATKPFNAPKGENCQKNHPALNTERNGQVFKHHTEGNESACTTADSTSSSDKQQQQPMPQSSGLTWAERLARSVKSGSAKRMSTSAKMLEQQKKSTDDGGTVRTIERGTKNGGTNDGDRAHEKKFRRNRGEGWRRNKESKGQESKLHDENTSKQEKKIRSSRRRLSRRSKQSDPSTLNFLNSDETNRSTTALSTKSADSVSKETSDASRAVGSTFSLPRSTKSATTIPHWALEDPQMCTSFAAQPKEQPSPSQEEQLEEKFNVTRDARCFTQPDTLLQPEGLDHMRVGFRGSKELLVFRLENSLLSLNPEYSFRGRHDSTHRTLVSFMWKSGGMRRGECIRFFFSDGVLTVTHALYVTLKESSQTAPTEKKMLQYIRYAIDSAITGTNQNSLGVHVWFHSDHWRDEETDTRGALEYFLRRVPSVCLCLQANGVELRQLSRRPLVYDSCLDPPAPEQCVVIIGGPKGFSPWCDQDVKNVVTSVGMPFFTVSFSKTIEFTSVLAGHIQMLDDLGYFYPSVLDLLSCGSEEAYAEMTSAADHAVALFANQTRRNRAGGM